jgi:hypothetical protein
MLSDILKGIAIQGAIDAGANVSPSMEAQIDKSNLKHSRNGDRINFALERLYIQLGFALQDNSVLAEIDEHDIEILNPKKSR